MKDLFGIAAVRGNRALLVVFLDKTGCSDFANYFAYCYIWTKKSSRNIKENLKTENHKGPAEVSLAKFYS